MVMEALKQIAVVVLFISLLTFVALFGRLPAFRFVPRKAHIEHFVDKLQGKHL